MRKGAHFRARAIHADDLSANRIVILKRKRARGAEAHPETAARDVAGHHQDHILAEARDLRFDLRPRALADAHHRNHRADANDNA